MEVKLPSGGTFTLDIEQVEPERADALGTSAAKLLAKLQEPEGENCFVGLRESIWPALALTLKEGALPGRVELHLHPLSRIGQTEGKSGSLVLFGNFKGGDMCGDSHPVVVKTLAKQEGKNLKEEHENALSVKHFAYESRDRFALPVHFDDEHDDYDVLWSRLAPAEAPWEAEAKDFLRVHDFREILKTGGDAEKIMQDALSLLRGLHRRLGHPIREERRYGTEYEWYLRGLDEQKWGPEWIEIWGDHNQPTFDDEGETRVNPFWVLERLRNVQRPLLLGAIHGDLHPGNVILSKGQVSLIDFGWSQDCVHIAKDFALLECNLRFLFLRPQLARADASLFSRWIGPEPPPEGLSQYCTARAALIQSLRQAAAGVLQSGDDNSNWSWDYLVPLFFVALGLLRYDDNLGNQQAAMDFVLALADHLRPLTEPEKDQ